MKRTRGTTNEILKPLENPENLVRKKKKPEGPSQPHNEAPLEVNPGGTIQAGSSLDTSALVRDFLRTDFSALSPTEEDPSEDTFPPRDEQPKSPVHTPVQRAPENLPTFDRNPNSPTSPEFTPIPTDQIYSSGGSTNGFQSALSVQLDALTSRIYSMDQTIAGRFCHTDQVILNTTSNIDQLRTLVNLQEDRSTLVLRELSEIRDEQRRQREELRAIRAELREIRK